MFLLWPAGTLTPMSRQERRGPISGIDARMFVLEMRRAAMATGARTEQAASERTTPIITFRSSVGSSAPPAAVYEVLADLRTHLDWAGRQAREKSFRLLDLQAPAGLASVGTTFGSTGANSKDGSSTFHDRSTVIEARTGSALAFETASRLDRKRRPTWACRFVHRYAIEPDGAGSRISYTCEVYPQNYRPYWLHPLMRPLTRGSVQHVVHRHLGNLARTVEARTKGA
jgi:hypothetical protein